MLRCLIIALFLGASGAKADIVVPVKTMRAGTVVGKDDLVRRSGTMPGVVADLEQAIGLETRVVLYAGRPIRIEDLVEPALVKRNQLVPLIFAQSGLSISTMGRALDRGAEGDIVRVMNLASKTTLFGVVLADGRIDLSSR